MHTRTRFPLIAALAILLVSTALLPVIKAAEVQNWTVTAAEGSAADLSNGVAEWTLYVGQAPLISFISSASSFNWAERDAVVTDTGSDATSDGGFSTTLQWIDRYVDDYSNGSECHQDLKNGTVVGWINFLGVVLPTQDCGSDIRAGAPFVAEDGATVEFDCGVAAHWRADIPQSLIPTVLDQVGVTGQFISVLSLEGHTTERMTAICALDIADVSATVSCATACWTGIGRSAALP